ncbi:hypothetical protein KAW80_00900 [Candidatus Babeliales bacterium]|nr:hypothetical protein [Candidatus Babeliales bacterium]
MKKGGFFQLVPFIIFVSLFLISTIWFGSKISPIFACLLAVMFSMFTFIEKTSFNKKIEIFVSGASNTTVISMAYIFIFASIFTYVLEKIGAISAAVYFSLKLIPSALILPGFFTVIALFAVAIGSSMGTIAAFLPIGIGLAYKLGISPALISGIVVGGAMLGDNLSIISDTTIAATRTTGCRMQDKFYANLALVTPAFFLTLLVLIFINNSIVARDLSLFVAPIGLDGLIKLIPYLLILVLALWGLDVIAVLIVGILAAISIGIYLGYFTFVSGSSLFLEGFTKSKSIHEVLILSFFVAGLSKMAEHNGGIDYLLDRLSKRVKSKAEAEIAISALIFLVNMAVAINTIAILITGPVAKRIAGKFNITAKRTAALLDIFSCICQGVIPYAPQLLLAGSIAGVTSVSIIPHLHYQFFILIIAIVSVGRGCFK